MKTVILLSLLALSLPASADLECYNTARQITVWRVGTIPNAIDTGPGVTVFCWATGRELQFIRQRYTGIRMAPYTRVVFWQGEDAVFIFDNINTEDQPVILPSP